MRKKLLISLIVAVAAFACTIGFAGCDLFSTGEKAHDCSDGHSAKLYDYKAATCTSEGNNKYWYCPDCGGYFSDEACTAKITVKDTVIPKAEHKIVIDEAVPATCTTDGKTEGKHCSECGKVTVVQTVIKAHHTEEEIAEVKATCTTDGLTAGKKCSVCNKILVEQTKVEAHHTIVIDPEVKATCTTDGLTEGKHCSACNKVLAEQTKIEAHHTEEVLPAVKATCTKEGKTEGRKCSVCNATLLAQQTIPAQGHMEEFIDGVEATCTASGKTQGKYCTICKQITKEQTIIPAKGHTEEVVPAVAATCTSTGLTEGKKCSDCGIVLVKQKIVNSTGHSGSGKLCTSCGSLLVSASEGLTFAEVTATRSGARSAVNVIGFEVTGRGSCTDADIVIPATHNGSPVLGIGQWAFADDAALRSVTIPNGVKYIKGMAFIGSANLTEVNLADSIERIDDSTFRETGITFFKCPANLKEIGGKNFVACMSLRTVIINSTVDPYMDIMIEFLANVSLTDIYYEGTREQWDTISRCGDSYHEDAGMYGSTPYPAYDVSINFYSETRPTSAGHYWHYVGDVPTKW